MKTILFRQHGGPEVLEYIDENLQHSISIQDLASVAGLNPTYFSDNFLWEL